MFLQCFSAFQSGYPNLLYSALEEGVNTTNSLAAYNGATIADVMNSWVSQAGHPVLMVEVNYETNSVTLTQVTKNCELKDRETAFWARVYFVFKRFWPLNSLLH